MPLIQWTNPLNLLSPISNTAGHVAKNITKERPPFENPSTPYYERYRPAPMGHYLPLPRIIRPLLKRSSEITQITLSDTRKRKPLKSHYHHREKGFTCHRTLDTMPIFSHVLCDDALLILSPNTGGSSPFIMRGGDNHPMGTGSGGKQFTIIR